jgi:hypothetical protein
MPEALAPALSAELSRTVTAPGYLIQIDLPGVTLRYSTRGAQTFDGQQWNPAAWIYREGQLSLPGGDPNVAAVFLSHDVYNRRVQVWMFYGDAVTPDTARQLFDGVIDGMPSIVDGITLRLWQSSASTLYAPRGIINAQNGFSVLPAPGLKFDWNGTTIEFGGGDG